MPATIGFALAWLASNAAAVLGASVAIQATVAASAAALGSAALAIGISLAVSYLTARPPIKPSDGQIETKDPLSPRRTSYGIVRMSGAVWFRAAIGRFYSLGLVHNDGRIGEIITIQVDENIIQTDGNPLSGLVISPAIYDSLNYVQWRLGAATETAYAGPLTDYGIPDMRGDGLFTTYSKFRNPASSDAFANAYPSGLPLVRVTFKASVCWDPRDNTQDREDETTWQWSENLAVCWLAYSLNPKGYGLPWERIEPALQDWKDAMDVCDEEVTLLNGGVAARYRVAGTWLHTTPPKDVIKNFEISCDGRLWQKRDGSVSIMVGKFIPPTVMLDDFDITGIDIQHGVDPLFDAAGVRAQFLSPDHDYREHDAEAWPDGETVLLLPEDRVIPMDLSWVPSHNQARRMMKVAYIKQNAEWRGTIDTLISGIQAIDQRWIRIKSNEVDDLDIIAEISSFIINPDMTCRIEFFSVTEDLYEFDATTEEGLPDGGSVDVANLMSQVSLTMDPIGDAGGTIGQTAFVFASSTAALAATPAGWTLIQKIFTNGVAVGSFWKKLDGTETAGTFLTVAGPIHCVIFDNAPAPVFFEQSIETSPAGAPGISRGFDPVNVPNVAVMHSAALADLATTEFVFYTADVIDPDYENHLDDVTHTITSSVQILIYSSSEEATGVGIESLNIAPALGLDAFVFQPGN